MERLLGWSVYYVFSTLRTDVINNSKISNYITSMLTKEKIHELNEYWFNASHKQTIPRYWKKTDKDFKKMIGKYVNKDYILSSETENKRKIDLFNLLKIIFNYINETENIEYFKNNKSDDLTSFYKYVKNRIIDNYPLVTLSMEEINSTIEDEKFKSWISNPLSLSSKSVRWEPKIDINQPNLKARYIRFKLLSKICCFIDEIQTNDYLINNITILNKRGIITGNTDKLVYGNKHILSAYLGQHIVRMFPFKDFKTFKSENLVKELKENKYFDDKVYEHFTPMSFFRDLIWVKPIQKKGNLFNGDSKHYNENEWLYILWYSYRTIDITVDENNKLNGKNKSRRLFGCYEDEGIEIKISNVKNWNGFHSIDELKKFLK